MEIREGREAPLRFVILCNSPNVEAWQAECIREVIASGAATVAGVVVRNNAAPPSGLDKWTKRWRDRSILAWRLFDRFCVRPFSKAVAPVDLFPLIGDAPRIADSPVSVGKYGQTLDAPTIEFVRSLKPDFILRFGYGILKGDILDVAPYGIWSYHHGDPASFRGQPPGFWEIFNGAKTAGVILQVLGAELDGGRILHRGTFAVTPQSYAKTRDTLYLGSTSFVARTCRDILANGWREERPTESRALGPVYRQPTTRQVARFAILSLLARVSAFHKYRWTRQNWNCAVVPQPIHIVAGLAGRDPQRDALRSAVWMSPGPDEFYADPFGFKRGASRFQIFFERFRWSADRGDIATTVFDGNTFEPCTTAFEAPTHLSYPYVVRRGDRHVFIPEHSAAREVCSFEFDDQGVAIGKVPIFPETDMIDTTFVEQGGRIWAFALIDNHAKNTHLHLFHAESYDGPWLAHCLNPIKSDVRSSRPAGTPFEHEGKLFRPAQDCSSVYGGAVTVNQIVIMTPTDFFEIEVSSVRPLSDGDYLDGLHTLSKMEDCTLIDGARRMRG